MKKTKIDETYLIETLRKLLEIPSPTGYTDSIVHFVGEELESIGIRFELTRRGAIRANIKGKVSTPDRAIVAHLDTLGAMVTRLKPNGRLSLCAIGHWSARFAEGARVTIFHGKGSSRGTILPLKASGHVYNEEIDKQPIAWDNIEIRVDELSESAENLHQLGFHVGDFVAVDPVPEFNPNGYINSRHLDNKAGVALLLASAKSIVKEKKELPVDCHLLFTISEEVGSGASAVLYQDVAEMVSIDNATPAPKQNSDERGVTIAIMDSSGPFDYHLTQKLIKICDDHKIPAVRDVFRFYRTDAASAVEAGNDLRTALVCFGCDASHGYERTHIRSLTSLAQLMSMYMQSPPTFKMDVDPLAPLSGFSSLPHKSYFDD